MAMMVRDFGNKIKNIFNPSYVKKHEVERGYGNTRPSFSDKLCITDFSDKHSMFLLEDGISVGSAFELGSLAAESATSEQIEAVFKNVIDVFSHVVDVHDKNPWVMQIYVNDEFSLNSAFEAYTSYISESQKKDDYTAAYLDI
jgi:hypothetical protein